MLELEGLEPHIVFPLPVAGAASATIKPIRITSTDIKNIPRDIKRGIISVLAEAENIGKNIVITEITRKAVVGGIIVRGFDVIKNALNNTLNSDESKKGEAKSKNEEGRGSNNRKPADDAEGDHTVINERGATADKRNDNNPNKNSKGAGFEEGKKVDYKGKEHYNKKTKEHVPTPHVYEGKDVRPAVPGKDMSKNIKP